jgi:hypothetical protein
MANISANPWFFTNTDQATSVAITSITNNVASILVTTGSAHGLLINAPVSLQGTVSYNGSYRIQSVPSTTTMLLANRQINWAAANGGAVGNVLSMAYIGGNVRAEQILWNPSAASQTLLLTDGSGNTIWNPTSQATADFEPAAYGKIYWFQNGLVINTLPSTGSVQMTIN